MPDQKDVGSKSIAVDADIYEKISEIAEEAGTSKSAVASAVLRLGFPYFRNRWAEFIKMYPELGKNGPPMPYTQNRPTVPLR